MAEQVTEQTTTLLSGSVSEYNNPIFLFCDGGEYSGWYASQEDGLKLQSDITDQYVEDNTAIQDHIGLKPLTFSLKGKIGDLVYNVWNDDTLGHALIQDNQGNMFKQAMTVINNIMPPKMSNYMAVSSAGTRVITDNLRKISTTALSIVGLGGMAVLRKKNPILAQQLKNSIASRATGGFTGERVAPQALNYTVTGLLSAWLNRVKFTIKNDFGTFENCYITDIDIKQTDQYTAEITCNLKQIRFVSTITTKIDYAKYNEFMAQQSAHEEDLQKPRGTQAYRDGKFFYATSQVLGQQ